MAPGASKMKKDTEVKKEKDKKKKKHAPKKRLLPRRSKQTSLQMSLQQQRSKQNRALAQVREEADLSGLLTSLKHQTVAKKASPEHRENARKILEDAHQQLFSISAYYT